MKRRIIVYVLLVVLAIAWMVWSYAVPHVTLSEGPLTYSQAQAYSPIPLPPSAVNVRVATFRHWLQSTTYVRFEAPLEDCRSLANQLLPGATTEVIRVAGTQPEDFPPPSTSLHFTAKELEWFDAHHVAAGERRSAPGGRTTITLAIPPTPAPENSSAVFYYRDGD